MKWFRRSSDNSLIKWPELRSEQQFHDLLSSIPQFALFKHSTRCSISTMAKNRLMSSPESLQDFPVYYVDVIQSRAVSNLIAELLGIVHQSPQLVLVKNGKAVYNRSHNAINPSEISSVL